MRAGGLAAAALTAALVLASSAGALADSPTPTPTPTTSSSSATDAAAQALAAQIVSLQRTAERKGEVAQKAGEKANDAQSAADTAQQALVDAQDAAAAAAVHAAQTRARASVVASQLARTNVGTLPLSLLLNANSAEGVLGGLSTTGQLSVESQQIYAQAKADAAEAERLKGVADLEATKAAAAAKVAATAYAEAKKEASSAKTAVDAALAEQRTLLTGDTDLSDVCGAVGSAPVAECLPTAGAAPSGNSVGAKVVRFALAQIGKPYVFAAAGPNAYDCSGLTLAAYASAGVSIGTHSATNQYDVAKAKGDLVPIADAKPGDLLFYTDGGGDMYHVTIYAGNGLMLEAPYPGSTVRGAPVRTGDLVAQAAHFG
jgi:cell wall-associated NlpC family hydrolase